MKRNMKRSLCALLVVMLTVSAMTVMADGKENVYVLTDAAGVAHRVIVNERDDDGNTQDESSKPLPVTAAFRYELDGQEIAPEELAGKSGHLVIRIDYENHETVQTEVGGEQMELPVPFLAATIWPLNADVYSNVEVTNGKVIDSGRLSTVVCLGLPGFSEAMNVGGYSDIDFDVDVPESAVISADVENYRNDGVYTVVTGIPADMADKKLPFSFDVESISGQLTDAMTQLTDGANRLADGSGTLLGGMNELAAGTGDLKAGADQLNEGAATLAEGLAELDANSAALTDGTAQIVTAVMGTVNETLGESADTFRAAGIELNELTLDNYTEEIDRIEAALLAVVETRVYEQADATLAEKVREAVREQVTEKVTDAVREEVNQKVYAAVREEVASKVESAMPDEVRKKVRMAVREQVKEKVTSGFTEQIEEKLRVAGVNEDEIPGKAAAELESEEMKAAVSEQVEAQMDSDEVKSLIEAQITEQLASDEVHEACSAEIDKQMASVIVQVLIGTKSAEAMQGDEAQAAITQNTDGQMETENVIAIINENIEAQKQSEEYLTGVRQAIEENGVKSDAYQSLEALRAKLDSIRAYSDGIARYTEAVGQAAQGAAQLSDGAGQLDTGAQALNSGVAELAAGTAALNDGMVQLRDGLAAFDDEAVKKLTGYLDGDVREILDRARAVIELHYNGYLDETADSTLFIIRTDGI